MVFIGKIILAFFHYRKNKQREDNNYFLFIPFYHILESPFSYFQLSQGIEWVLVLLWEYFLSYTRAHTFPSVQNVNALATSVQSICSVTRTQAASPATDFHCILQPTAFVANQCCKHTNLESGRSKLDETDAQLNGEPGLTHRPCCWAADSCCDLAHSGGQGHGRHQQFAAE